MRRLIETIKFSKADSLYQKTNFFYNRSGDNILEMIYLKDLNSEYKLFFSVERFFNELNLIERIVEKDEENNKIKNIYVYKYFNHQ